MRAAQPIVRTFRYLLQKFPYSVRKSWQYEWLLSSVDRLLCLMRCRHDIAYVRRTVYTALVLLRQADSMAQKTIAVNSGPNTAVIVEAGRIIAMVGAGESKELTLSGRFAISAKCPVGSADLEIVTYHRCLCGDPYVYSPSQAIGVDQI